MCDGVHVVLGVGEFEALEGGPFVGGLSLAEGDEEGEVVGWKVGVGVEEKDVRFAGVVGAEVHLGSALRDGNVYLL